MRTTPSLIASTVLVAALGAHPVHASAPRAGSTVPATSPGQALTISVPALVLFGARVPGTVFNGNMGTVTVVDARPGNRNWTATVASTNFTTGSGTGPQTISRNNVSYWSGPTTAQTGGGTRLPGQLTAAQQVSLSVSRTAFRASKPQGTSTTSWRPTLVITIPSSAVTGSYTGVITHSVA
ncbi:hypothetical protein [Nonomuraea cavernae]|uniref:WxL domain-containing protein n=1 Tax=Nonomuraea cavernae TaxID=2045107 RepID=A0A918DM21_9ACTN|nr:hypothetical protein [Nonomuraea cavernae]MCA2187112.1 hypothetical protein [Nonomuraea cavernae]GGO74718.1 hypothetical protein GCM10012289_48050 [Nonomuraea cavernae]